MLKTLLKDIFTGSSPIQDRRDIASDGFADRDRWVQQLIVRMFRLIHNVESDNFDAARYGNLPRDAFFYEAHAAYFTYFLNNAGHFFEAFNLLEDEMSKELYQQLILYRMLGHLHVRLPFNTAENRAHLLTAERWRVEDTEDAGAFGPLSIFLVPTARDNIRVKGWKENVTWTFLYRQYYFERAGVKISPQPGDHVIDAGGCFGDTALGFADAVGEQGHVYVFDPLPKHCAIMRQVQVMNPSLAPRISIFPIGLSDVGNDVAPLVHNSVINPGARVIPDEMPMGTIDEVAVSSDIPRVDFIKMDIEGSELSALRGAESILRRWKPKLAISLYHRPEDFFSIPLWIESLGLGYRYFIEHYSIHHEETVLFAAV
jgi:FkbM family methyltransferase